MSFCRITGRSRGLPKPHFFPILPPSGSNESQRFCRITGKSIGLPKHHYIPILNKTPSLVLRCKITSVSEVINGKRKHTLLENFTYIKPILKPNDKAQKPLIDILKGKIGEGDFVYTNDEQKSGFVFPPELELAVVHGDVEDVMLAKKRDKMVFRLREGQNIFVDVEEIPTSKLLEMELFEGEGVQQPDEIDTKDNKRHVTEKTKTSLSVNRKEWSSIIEPLLKTLNWDEFEQESSKSVYHSLWGYENPDEAVEHLATLNGGSKQLAVAIDSIQCAIDNIATEIQLEQTANVMKKLCEDKRNLEKLPVLNEVNDVVKKISESSPANLANISGNSLHLNRPIFIVGQTVQTKNGKIFVPGQTITEQNGTSRFLPGMVVNTCDGPAFIPGVVMGNKFRQTPVFLPGENVKSPQTDDYQFVHGLKLILCEVLDNNKEDEKVNFKNTLDITEEKLEHTKNYLMENYQIEASSEACCAVLAISALTRKLAFVTDLAKIPDGEFEKLFTDCLTLIKNHPVITDEQLNKFIYDHLDNVDLDAFESVICDVLIQYPDEIATTQTLNFKQVVDEMQEDQIYNLDLDVVHDEIEKYFPAEKKDTMVDIAASLIYLAKNIATNTVIGDVHMENDNDDSKIINGILKHLVDDFRVTANIPIEKLIEKISEGFKNVTIDESFQHNLMQIFSKLPNKKQLIERTYNLSNIDKNNLGENRFVIIENISHLLDEPELCTMFRSIAKTDENFLTSVLAEIGDKLPEVTVQNVEELLKNIVSQSIGNYSEQKFVTLLENGLEKGGADAEELKNILSTVKALAIALNNTEVAYQLEFATDKTLSELTQNKSVMELIKHVIMIDQVTQQMPEVGEALKTLKQNPYAARSDPKMCALVRFGSVLNKSSSVQNSADVPISFMTDTSNILAREDFITKNNIPRTLLIIKGNFQMVFPKEASRAILNGQVPYTLIDEKGVRHFKPMDMISALNLSQPTVKRFSMYRCLDNLLNKITPAYTSENVMI